MNSLYASAVSSTKTVPDTLNVTPTSRRYELDEMRVIASRPQESTGSVNIVNLYNTPKTSDIYLSDVLKDISGIQITVGGRGESNLRIRGFQKENIKIMVDGRQINAGYFGNVNLAEMVMFDISEIHLVKGAVSPLYGVNSSGGVVNFVTRSPSKESWVTLKSSVKRNNTQNLQLITAHKFDLWDYWLNLSGFKTDGFMLSNSFKATPSENGGVRDFSNNMGYNIQSKVNFNLFDTHTFGLSAGFSFADERNVPGNIYESRYRLFKDLKRGHLSGLASFQATPFLNLQPYIYYDAYENIYQEFNSPVFIEENKGLDSILQSWTFGVQNKLEYILSNKNILHHLFTYEKQAYNRKDNQAYLEWTSNSTILYNTSFLFSHKLNHLWQSSMSLGLSQSIRNYKQNSWDIHNNTIETDLHLEPSFSLYFEDGINNVNFAISRNIQYPYLRQLYSSSRGNPELMPEKAIKSEISAGTVLPFTKAFLIPTVSVFYNILDDMIDRVNSPIYINQRKLESAGLEMTVLTNVNFFDFIYRDNNNHPIIIETEHSLDYINLKMNKNYNFSEIPQWSSDHSIYIYMFSDIKFWYSINWSDISYSPDSYGRLQTLSSKTVHNSGIGYTFKRHKIAFSISNLFDLDYMEEWGYPAPGRNFSLSCELILF